MRTLLGPVVAFAGLVAGAHASVIVVQAGGPFTSLQQAVDVAQVGDTILVKGTWDAPQDVVQIHGKALSLVADSGATLKLGGVVVSSLGADGTVLLRGLQLSGKHPETKDGALQLFQDDGHVRVEACTLAGLPGTSGDWFPFVQPEHGEPGASVSYCADVAFHDCTLAGGAGATLYDDDIEVSSTSGGDGLVVRSSSVVLAGCKLLGGHGGHGQDGGEDGGHGGHGLVNETGTVSLEDCRLTGGNAGSANCDAFGCGSVGNTGFGLESLYAAAHTLLRASTLNGGKLTGQQGQGPPSWIGGGTLSTYDEPANSFTVDSPVREGGTATLHFGGLPGDQLFLWMATGADALAKPALQGTFLLGPPFLIVQAPAGSIPGGGAATLEELIPELGPGVDVLQAQLQLVVVRSGQPLLGPWASLTLLDGAY